MITNHFKVLFFLIFINTQCYAFDAFVINEKTSLFSANHMTSPVIQAGYVGWKAGWDWAGATINPEYTHQQTPYSGSTFSARVDKLDIDFTGEVIVSDKQIDWVYQWTKGTDIPDAIGFGIDFKLERFSLGFLQGSEDPELLPDNKGWSWQTPDGQTIEVTFSPALASLSFEQGQKSLIRALFFTDISQGAQQTTMTIKASQTVSISGPVVLDYDNSDPAQWHRDLLPKNTSPVDLSFLNEHEKPAGKHGFVLANKDELFFEDNTPVKFWGTNVIAYSLFSSSDSDIETHAKRIAKFGYNLVRIHHHDSLWVTPNIFQNPTENTNELSNEALRKIDLWVKHLKAEGVYIWLDLHVGRSFTANDGIDNFDDFAKGSNQAEVKGFNYYNESIQSAMQAFNESYLNHVNSYTGIAYKDDPAVISMLITNENDLTQHFGNSLLADKNVPLHHAIFSEDVHQFSETYSLDENKVGQTWKMGYSKIYLNDAEHRFNQKMISHLEQLGVKSLIATTNSWGQMGLYGLPSLTDGSIVDVHSYGKSEEFKFNPRANPGFLTWAGAAQVTGKPMSFTEWNIEPFPATRDRFIAPIYTASIAKLQGWDAIMQYGYGQDTNWGTRASNYSSHNDPGMMALMPAASLLFRQDHVAEANNLYELKLNKNDFFFTKQDPRTSKSIRTLLETSRFTIGMPETTELPWLEHNIDNQNAIVVTDANQDFIPAGQDYVESDTQELKRDWTTGIHTINTEKSQIASGWIGGKSIILDDVSFNITTKKAAIAVQTLENKPIRESNSIFITIVARSQPENGFNTVPFLSEPVTGQISVQAPAGLKLYPVNSDGHLGAQISIIRDNQGKYNIDFTSNMETHWFKLQNTSIPFRISSPANNAQFFHSETITIKTNGADLDDITQVQFFNGNGDLLETSVSAPFEYSTNSLAAGSHSILAQATYEDGTNSSKTVTFTVGEAPFSITSPSDGAIFEENEPIVIKTNAPSLNGNIDRLHFWRDNFDEWLGESNTPPYELTVNNLSPGEHILQTRVVFEDNTSQNASIQVIVGDETEQTLIVNNIQALVTNEAATITWDTTELSDSTVNYGLDTTYGTSETDTNLVNSHSIILTGLTANTVYHFQVLSTDENSINNIPTDQVFTTTNVIDITAPVITDIQTTITNTSAIITWNTNEAADSAVSFGLDDSYGTITDSADDVTSHSIELTNLLPVTSYHFEVSSADASANISSSSDQTFTTDAVADITPPVASTISTAVTDTTATITWTTDEPSTSVINYGESTPYTDTDASDTTLVTDHSVTLSGLTADTDYHFEIVSTDVSSNSGASADQLFTTGITINNGWWNNNWNYRASITVNSGNYARSEKPVEVIINFTSYLDAIDQTTAFDENSIRVHEVDVNGNIIAQNISFQFDSATDFDATTNAQGTLVFLLSGNTASQTDRYFQVYFDVEGGGYTPSTFTSQVNVTNDVSDEGQNSFQINSGNANYFYQKQGAGFSSIVDNNGNDWISYHQEVSGESGAANQFRGLPNLVSPANGGDFHPGATSALSVLMHEGPLKATIESITTDGLWKVQWEFFPNFARMTVNLAAENYWFLYEGTPGGTLDLADFMMRSDETQNLVDASWTSDISDPEWVYFSDPNVGNGRSLFLAHHTDDSAIDSYSPLDSATDLQMTVFGFGRDGMNSFIDKNQTHQFTIGLTDSTDFAGTSATIESAYRTINATITSSDQNPGVGGSNTAPTVEAGDDQTIALSVDATLDGTVSDDGLPTTPGTVTTLWTLISGPTDGTVLFADATQVDTTANFSVEGTYVLDLDADDSELASNDQITITVNAGGIDTTAPTIVGTISTTVTETTAILTWVTDEPTTSTVNYGENTTYSDTDNTDNVLVTNHSITLSNLTPETEYHFEVISSDGADNSATSADQSFTTSTQSIQNYTIYEDGEDGTTDGWIIYDQNPAGATITNVDDTDTASRIILFQGEGLQNGYRLGGNGGTPEAWNNASKVINWDMKFEESFVIYITVETTLGQRYLTYNQSSTSKIDGIYIINGLDNNQGTINSQWTSVSRNLESDLQVFEPTNEIISVNGFLVRGDGRIDNIKLPETTVNTAPTVEAGDDQTIALSVDATLDGTVSDDGLPTTPGTVTTLWTLISGPTGGTVLFADATQVDTTANFSVEGTYVLDLDADDSELASNDQITITVNAGGIDTTAPTIVGTISTTVTETTAILTWVTDEPTTSTVNYGENTTYSDTDNTDNVLVTNHSITLSNLTPETEYHFEVISSDGADNSATSADQSFTTSTQSIQNYTIYEDGEDGTTDGWIIYDQNPAGATITNVDDTDTASRIILFQGEGLQNGYRLGGNGGTPEAWNNASKVINWDMKFEESFVIYITVETTLGQRYLTYNQSSTSKIDGIYIINGLDNNQGTINSQWTSVSRNLESDLQVFEPTNEIISVNGFLVRGDGRIDNIKLPETTVNTAPTVDAGVAQTIALSVDATLDGTVSDDGLPTTPGTVTTLWTLISGPTGGTVLFADATQVDTTANFSVEGTYVLDLDADDSELTSNDQITITVNTGGIDTTAPTIVGTISTTVTETTAILTWVTDEPTTSTVNYGENTTYSDTDNTDNVLVTNHSITLSNLTPETEYHFEVISSDGADNSATSADQSFTTSTQSIQNYTIYEDGEDGTTDGWIIYDQDPAGATITNVDDTDTASRIILFQGEGLQNGYRLGGNGGTPEAWNNASKVINWDMKFEESFVIYITVETTLGQRYLTYNQSSTSKIDRIYIINGLDNNQGTINSQWTSVSRNLESDLQVFEPTNEIISVNGFLVRGDGRIDNIKLPETTVNTAPTVDAGVAQTIALSVDATLDGTVSDDGLPTTPGTVTTLWTLISGPTGGTVLFADATQVDTTANFSVEGTYVLDLDADDSELANNDQITITVNAGGADTTAPTIVGAISTTVTETTAILTWVTDELTTSTVNYGENIPYSEIDNTDNVLATNHSITLSNLTPETEYHFEVISSDGADNSATSADQSFTTSTQSIQNYTIYEDGEDGTTDGWIIYDQDPAGATITNVDDTDTASRIILFQGEGLQNGYRLGGNGGTPEAWNNASKVINWDMKFEESFVIYITVETTLGQRYLTYNQSSTNKIDGIYIINGLDNNQGTINSQWTSVSRNLESDLQVFEPTNEIISVNGFLVRGDGRIDNIKLPETTVNTAPTVDAGVAQTIALSVDATLDGTVSDDDLPTTPGAVTTLWTLISGPTSAQS